MASTCSSLRCYLLVPRSMRDSRHGGPRGPKVSPAYVFFASQKVGFISGEVISVTGAEPLPIYRLPTIASKI